MRFAKWQGTGNDFILLEAQGEERDWPRLARAMCDRHFGVGADGILLALPSECADLRMRMLNPDGSEAEMCGNGLRCLVRHAVERGLARFQDCGLRVETGAGVLTVELLSEDRRQGWVRVGMGRPRFAPAEIPVLTETEPPVRNLSLTVDGQIVSVTCVSMGNPHAVHFHARPVATYPLELVGPKVETHPLFPQRVNFEVARVLNRELIEARVWERGAGATLACGSGASAVMVAARLHNLVEDRVEVRLPGGILLLEWDGEGEVYLSGPAERVFTGEWPNERLLSP
jgi:diaminopimelate epimerase